MGSYDVIHFVRRRGAVAALIAIVAAALLATWGGRRVERRGLAFFHAGEAAVVTLGRAATALRSGELDAFERTLADGYGGRELGLGRLARVEERDGVRRYAFSPSTAPRDRAGAVRDWADYLAGFDSVDEVGLHVDSLVEWQREGEARADVRFELIGTPRGEGRPAIDRARFAVRFEGGLDDLRIASMELLAGERDAATEPLFVERGAAAGIDFENRFYPRFLDTPLAFRMIRFGPGGISAVDVDDDGFYDLFVPDGVESRLLRNRGDGTFEDVTTAVGLGGLDGVSVGVFADMDDDGDKDLFVSRTFTPNRLFRNDDGRFTDVTAGSGLGEDCCTTVASWADVDRDGDLDLYVGRYLDPRRAIPTTFYARNGEPNRLYLNDGDGRFTDVTAAAGVGDTGLCLGTAFGDYDDDGWPDLWVANDFGRKTLYRNRGDGTFEDVTERSGTLAYGAGMSASFGDYDNDGRLDLYVAHIRSDHGWFAEAPTVWRYLLSSLRQGVWRSDLPLTFEVFRQSGGDLVGVFQQMASGNTLLRNRGDGTFEDVTVAARANPPGWFWGSGFADFDNDGWQDLYSANGWIYRDRDTELELSFLDNVVSEMQTYKTGAFFDPDNPIYFGSRSWHGWERNRYLRNERDGTFRELGRATGTDLLTNSRGIAVADFENRGVLDVAVAASTDRHALLRNQALSGRGWIEVELVGAGRSRDDGSNRDAVGARVTVEAGGLRQIREVALGDGYGSQNSLRLHFGLGEATVIDSLTVRWPRSGEVETFSAVEPNRIVRVVEGRHELEARIDSRPAAKPVG